MKTTSPSVSAIVAACRHIERQDQAPSLSALAQRAGLSPSHFQRCFKAVVGLSPKAYALACRARRLELQMAVSSSVTSAIYAAGFESPGRFYETSRRRLGMAPPRWKKGGVGETVVFAVGSTRLGALLVAATPHGLCAVWLDDDPNVLVSRLQDRFHRAHLVPGSVQFHEVVSQVAGLIERSSPACEFPLDVRGTVFQERIWRALAQVPPRACVSYAELARLAGVPRAVRAVASACARNELAYVIPCHRIVPLSGGVGQYRWGVERKAALLDAESAIVPVCS